MAHWNYRVVHKVIGMPGRTEDSYGVHEVYYFDEGTGEPQPGSCTETPVEPYGETLEELREDFQRHLDALDKPVLEYSLFEAKEKKDDTGK